jgi:uncharacterized protein YndB with AHSA1/START domain
VSESETVSLDFELKSPIERVWHALTDAAALSAWTMFETDDFRAVVGHRFRFRGKADSGWTGVVDCEVLTVDAPRELAYTWAAQMGGTPLAQTTVRWTLTSAAGGVTRLHLDQSGFDRAARQEIGGATYAWRHMVGQLQSLLTNG